MNYPIELRRCEAATIRRRRAKAQLESPDGSAVADPDRLPADTVGLALSGGGIRSATLSLGVLQALAKKNLLRRIDFLSSVSGGGFAGSFVGRLFTRGVVRDHDDPCGRAQSIIGNNQSPQLEWLRAHANYIFNQDSDLAEGLGSFWRNLSTIYLVLGFLSLGLFGLLRVGGDQLERLVGLPDLPAMAGPHTAGMLKLSHWWPLPLAILVVVVVPCSLAFWLAPGRRTRSTFSFFPLAAWLLLLAGFGLSLTLPDFTRTATIGILILLLTAAWFEMARRRLPERPDPAVRETPVAPGVVIRNRLTRALGEGLGLLFATLLWVLIDTLARSFAEGKLVMLITAWGALLAPTLPFLRRWAALLGKSTAREGASESTSTWRTSIAFRAGVIAFPLATFLLVVLDGGVHWLFNRNLTLGLASLVLGLGASLILGRAYHFLNYSSLQQSYATRLCRTFLGASNPARFRSTPDEGGWDVTVTHPNDDIKFEEYHPEEHGGPLHLLNVCVNETVDAASERDVPDRKGLSMCVGPCGASVGREFHSLWSEPPEHVPWRVQLHRMIEQRTDGARAPTALRPITRAGQLFHVLAGKTDDPVVVEALSLSSWTAISGAAFGTGTGRMTCIPLALLLGLANLRLGYWWDSGLSRSDRPGLYRSNLWRRLKHVPGWSVPMQTLLLSEFRGRFGGPSRRRWNLSDGGHFDGTGLYELLRRRVPFIIAVDAGEDPGFGFSDDAELVRQARIDFGVNIEFLNDPATEVARAGCPGAIPAWIGMWLNPEALGKLSDIGKNGTRHAALARATYTDQPNQTTWILLLKSSLSGDESLDIVAYRTTHPTFPNEPTTDQFFNESQWESYRCLGEHIADSVFS